MKKSLKITLLVLLIITFIVVIAAIVMLKSVTSDSLFYMNSTLGNIYALSYRWICLASGVLILFWIILAVKKRSLISAMIVKFNLIKKTNTSENRNISATTNVPVSSGTDTEETTDIKTPNALFCTKCGKQISTKTKFCPFCGESVVAAPPKES